MQNSTISFKPSSSSSYDRISMIQMRYKKRIGAKSLFCYYPSLLAVTELGQHHVLSSKTVRPIIPRGARCVGHVKILWSAAYSLAVCLQFVHLSTLTFRCRRETPFVPKQTKTSNPSTQVIEFDSGCSGQTHSKKLFATLEMKTQNAEVLLE